jgi:hypothetical protein
MHFIPPMVACRLPGVAYPGRLGARFIDASQLSQPASLRLLPDRHGGNMKTKTCPDFNGDGVIDKGTDDEHQCPTCGGSGVVPDDDHDEEVIRTTSSSPKQKKTKSEASSVTIVPHGVGFTEVVEREPVNNKKTQCRRAKRHGLSHNLRLL